jgi:predicted nuclease of predicted toxin-antitoxin system
MTRFYSNENLPLAIVEVLRNFGYNILTSYDAGQANQGIPDDDVLAYATNQNRILITLNRDDFLALHKSGVNHQGIIICKDDRDYRSQAEALHTYLKNQTQELQNRLIRVQKQNQPKSSQKIFIIREYIR